MQDRYVGDVGDYGKYALLRSLVGGGDIRLGVHWCMCADETHNGDGRHVAYLQSGLLRALDPKLHDVLNRLVATGKRSVVEVIASGILPDDTLHFLENQSQSAFARSPPAERIATREASSRKALQALSGAEIIFLDPDNGIEAQSVPAGSRKASKYVFWSELESLWESDKSLVIYHHTNRTMSTRRQIDRLASEFKRRLRPVATIDAMVFRRGSCRTFWIIAQERHKNLLSIRIDEMMSRGWKGHFERVQSFDPFAKAQGLVVPLSS